MPNVSNLCKRPAVSTINHFITKPLGYYNPSKLEHQPNYQKTPSGECNELPVVHIVNVLQVSARPVAQRPIGEAVLQLACERPVVSETNVLQEEGCKSISYYKQTITSDILITYIAQNVLLRTKSQQNPSINKSVINCQNVKNTQKCCEIIFFIENNSKKNHRFAT